MTRLFLDTNIVVDVLERREPFCHDAVQLFTMAYNKQVPTFYYLCFLKSLNIKH